VRDLNAAVAALAALAPLMVMTMGEMMSVAIRAPRRRIIETTPVDIQTLVDSAGTDVSRHDHAADAAESSATTAQPAVYEDLDNGLLKPAVWASVYLWLEHPDMSNSDIARELGIHTSTVGRHLKAWNDVQRKMAHRRSVEHATGIQRNDDDSADVTMSDEAVRDTEDSRGFDARRNAATSYSAVDVDADTLEYVGATR
jgi:DNA-binding CsgD family transcriptional regulator